MDEIDDRRIGRVDAIGNWIRPDDEEGAARYSRLLDLGFEGNTDPQLSGAYRNKGAMVFVDASRAEITRPATAEGEPPDHIRPLRESLPEWEPDDGS